MIINHDNSTDPELEMLEQAIMMEIMVAIVITQNGDLIVTII